MPGYSVQIVVRHLAGGCQRGLKGMYCISRGVLYNKLVPRGRRVRWPSDGGGLAGWDDCLLLGIFVIALDVRRDRPGGLDGPVVLFRDQRFVVLDKPAGLPVHAGPSGGVCIEDWFPLLSRRKDGPWLAHRLDADTAGCLVVALRRAALLAAQGQFAAGLARKTYWAVVAGEARAEQGTVSAGLRRLSEPKGWRMVVDQQSGQAAVTEWRVLGRADGLTWLALRPRTGRTHQIRVHCAWAGMPILGDERYGTAGGGLHLLARAIHLPLDPPVDATAAPPPHMAAALTQCGFHP